MDIPTWDQMNHSQKRNYKSKNKEEYEKFRAILWAERPHLMVNFHHRLQIQQMYAAAKQSDVSKEAIRLQKEKTKQLLQTELKPSLEEVTASLEKAKAIKAELQAAKRTEKDGSQPLEPTLTQREEKVTSQRKAESSGPQDQPEAQSPTDAATDKQADQPAKPSAKGKKKKGTSGLKENSKIIAQALEANKNAAESPAKSSKQASAKLKQAAIPHLAKHVESHQKGTIHSDKLSLQGML